MVKVQKISTQTIDKIYNTKYLNLSGEEWVWVCFMIYKIKCFPTTSEGLDIAGLADVVGDCTRL